MSGGNGGTDYFTIEVIQHALQAMGQEMFTIIRRTAHSPLIFETLDCAVGATDRDGEIVCMGNGVTGFLGTLDAAVRDVIEKYAKPGNIAPDDIFMLNTPYEGGGSHLSDVSLVMPVFDGDEIVGYVVNKAHWTEVGGMDPGSVTTNSTEIYQEGLHFPNIRLCDAGRMNEPIIEMIRANVRLPDMTVGDLWGGHLGPQGRRTAPEDPDRQVRARPRARGHGEADGIRRSHGPGTPEVAAQGHLLRHRSPGLRWSGQRPLRDHLRGDHHRR